MATNNSSYDINAIFASMELDLIQSYQRNMARHARDMEREGFEWEMWQSKKLRDLQQLRKEARILVNKHTRQAVTAADGILVNNYTSGKRQADAIIKRFMKGIEDSASFGATDRRKVNAILDAVQNDFLTASSSALRLVDDQYRQIVFKTQVAFSAGAITLPQAIDIAARDFLQQGINSIIYANGNRVNISGYAEMVMRTSAKRAKLTGEGARNNELGVELVQITSYGACSDTCLPFQGKVFVDDVYSGGKADNLHPLLSTAMKGGLFHPNCRHMSQPWFEGISSVPFPLDEEKVRATYQAEQRQREIERNIRKYKRVEAGSVDPANAAKAKAKVNQWQAEMRSHLKTNDFLSRKSYRERA